MNFTGILYLKMLNLKREVIIIVTATMHAFAMSKSGKHKKYMFFKACNTRTAMATLLRQTAHSENLRIIIASISP